MRNAERAEASNSLKLSMQVYVANIFTERTLVSFRKDTAYIIGLFFSAASFSRLWDYRIQPAQFPTLFCSEAWRTQDKGH